MDVEVGVISTQGSGGHKIIIDSIKRGDNLTLCVKLGIGNQEKPALGQWSANLAPGHTDRQSLPQAVIEGD